MQVRVLFFGRLKEIIGRAEESAEVGKGDRVEDLFARYGQRYPEFARFRASVVASINQEFAEWGAPLNGGDEVAFLPPVSGGAENAHVEHGDEVVEIVRDAIRVAEIVTWLKAPEDGAVVAFEGIVRNHSAGRRTLYLDYEAYEAMALAKMREIGNIMRQRFSVRSVALIHRLGR